MSGELALSGQLRPVKGVLSIALEGFLLRRDKDNLRRRKALCRIATNLGTELSDHLRKLTFEEPEPEFEDEDS